MDIGRELRRYLRVLWSWAWLIILGAALAGGVNYYLASKAPPRYEANTTLMVGQFIRQANPDQQEVGLSDRLAGYYLELLHRQPVLEGVKKELNLDKSNEALAGTVTARVVPGTAFIEIAVVDPDPFLAVKMVNSFARELIKQSPTAPENQQVEQRAFIQKQLDDLQAKILDGKKQVGDLNQSLNSSTTAVEITETRNKIKAMESQIDGWQTNYTNLLRLSNTLSPNSISILEESNQSRQVKSLSPLISAAIAAAVGAFLAFGCAVVLEYLDDRIKSADDLQSRFKMTLLGHLPRQSLKEPKADNNELGEAPVNLDVVQSYEVICTSILFSDLLQNHRRSVMITSVDSLSEKSRLTVNLAIAMVGFEQSVLLIDADTRNGQLHELLGLENRMGFYEVFYGNGYVHMDDKVQETAVPNLFLMSSGISASAEANKIVALRPGTHQIYSLPHQSVPGDFVLFNCGSILSDKTPRLLASHVTGTVLLCELNHTRGQELKSAIEVVERLKGNILGVITIDRTSRSPSFMRLGKRSKRAKTNTSLENVTGAADSSVF